MRDNMTIVFATDGPLKNKQFTVKEFFGKDWRKHPFWAFAAVDAINLHIREGRVNAEGSWRLHLFRKGTKVRSILRVM